MMRQELYVGRNQYEKIEQPSLALPPRSPLIQLPLKIYPLQLFMFMSKCYVDENEQGCNEL